MVFKGVLDNKLTESRFELLFEEFDPGPTGTDTNTDGGTTTTTGYHSLAAHHLSLALHYPITVLFWQTEGLQMVPAHGMIWFLVREIRML